MQERERDGKGIRESVRGREGNRRCVGGRERESEQYTIGGVWERERTRECKINRSSISAKLGHRLGVQPNPTPCY